MALDATGRGGLMFMYEFSHILGQPKRLVGCWKFENGITAALHWLADWHSYAPISAAMGWDRMGWDWMVWYGWFRCTAIQLSLPVISSKAEMQLNAPASGKARIPLTSDSWEAVHIDCNTSWPKSDGSLLQWADNITHTWMIQWLHDHEADAPATPATTTTHLSIFAGRWGVAWICANLLKFN